MCALAVLSRTLLVTLIPLTAYAQLGSAERVSVLYLIASFTGVGASLTMPLVTGRLGRAASMVLCTTVACTAGVLLAFGNTSIFIVGMGLQIFSTTAFEIVLALYIQDKIPRRQLAQFEPWRVFLAASAFMSGPWLGVWIAQSVYWLPYAISGVAAIAATALVLTLPSLAETRVRTAKRTPFNPAAFARRYFRQPRLRLAWLLAMGRSSWWALFILYTPLFAVSSGLGPEVGSALVSIGSGALLLVPIWGMIGRRIGLRRLLAIGYVLTGTATFLAGLTTGEPWIAGGMLVAAAVAASVVDAAGNVPFLRAVRSYERREMTSVFTTYRDTAQIMTPAFGAALISIGGFASVFAIGGVLWVGLAQYCRFLPRRL
ncbi:MFS transporter [Acuticoccus kandeliae]|uniref:MFS transporter n=1 Tax=Acuticoccus kandeliae TaxID=2073160 RepID=UPI0013007A21|nr:MFS transporter [Acuticoccus kandeliae]